MKTGTRTQVATSLILGSRIFLVSTTIFHSSLVKPSSMEHVDMRDHVEGDALGKLLALGLVHGEDRLGLREQLVHRLLAGARHRLVGRHHHALDPRLVVQRLERHDELRGRAVRVGDDALLAETRDRVGVDLRHDQRHVGVVAPARRIIDHHRAVGGDLRRPFLRHRGAGRHQADVDVGEIVMVERLALERLVAVRDLDCPGCGARRARRPRRRETPARRGSSSIRGPTLPVAPTTATLKPIVTLHRNFPAACLAERSAALLGEKAGEDNANSDDPAACCNEMSAWRARLDRRQGPKLRGPRRDVAPITCSGTDLPTARSRRAADRSRRDNRARPCARRLRAPACCTASSSSRAYRPIAGAIVPAGRRS